MTAPARKVSTDAQDQQDRGAIPRRRSLRILSYEIGFVIALTAIAAMLTAAMLEIQTTATAYVVGEGHWSRAQQDAAHTLYRYAADGDPAQLAQIRKSLLVPLGDRAARLAMERDPIDVDEARKGFLQGRIDSEDVDRLIRMYRYMRDAPYFRHSVAQWRLGDEGILDLQLLAGEIELAYQQGTPDPATIKAFQDRAQAVNSSLRPIETTFSESMLQGTRLLRNVLLGISVVLFLIVSWLVIVVLRSTMNRIRGSESTFRAAFHQAAVGMLRMNVDSRILEANETIGHILGRTPDRLAGMRLVELMHAEDRSSVAPSDSEAIDWSLHLKPSEHRFLREDGSTCWLRWTVSMIDGDTHGKERVFALIEDVSEARRVSDEMKYQASHDALTGLINRREIERRLQRGIESARDSGEIHAFLFLDLDQFKLINDTCGHVAGDQLLRQIAGVLMLHMRGNDWMGRLGGDEFAVLLECTGQEEAVRIGQRVRRALAASTFSWEGSRFNVTCSVGIVSVDGAKLDVGHVLRAADRACYQAKEDGRNCIRVYHESDQAMSRRRDEMAWVNEIRDAISNGRFQLYGQRIETLDGARRLNYEVLVRLVDAQGALHSPDSFLPAAERYGEAVAIDRLVVSMALDELARHPRHLIHLELCHLNISAQSIANPEFRRHVAELLDNSEVPPRKLCFELTETAAIANIAQAREFMEDMRSRGCRIALDDFGSGLSSFAYLKNLPVDILKIDGIFIRDIANNPIDPVLVRSICEMARSLGKVTVAEWVEDRRMLAQLKTLGVDQAQGHGIHEPCALADLIRQGLPPRRPAKI
ncbi:putative bifunctional diguanylate cyclase/phosphodiesterase [Dokdonella sp.]|uniref:putative bifunctional diguanylate cyclase/phosphodiesterase n=1 Tax=Dokdonella sp. TaxID=2291710 RepID=UPI003C3CCCEF